MVIAWIAGGLGNQMYQYAFGRAVSAASGRRLRLDLAHYRRTTKRRYELHSFNTRGRRLGRAGEFLTTRFNAPRYSRWKHLFPLCEVVEDLYADVLPSSSYPLYLRGYWQGERFFQSVASELRAEFTLRSPWSDTAEDLARRIAGHESVAVHVRRGDLVTNERYRSIHGVLDPSYYDTAARRMLELLKAPYFYVFSDDMGWVRRSLRLPGNTIHVETELSPAEALILMSRCRHQVIANSSFSWWAAWLNLSATKRVIAPRRWFAVQGKEKPGLMPEGWARL